MLPDTQRELLRRCDADAERSSRGCTSGHRPAQVKQVSVWCLDGMTFQSDLEAYKCPSVRSASHVCLRGRNLTKWTWGCVSVYTLTVRIATLRLSIRRMIKRTSTPSDSSRNISPWACVPPCVQDELLGHQMWWWVIRIVAMLAMTKNPLLDEGDHVHEDHDVHCSASGTEDCLVMCSLFHCTTLYLFWVFFGLYGVVVYSLVVLYDLVLVSVVSPFVRRSEVNPLFIRIACIFVRASALGTARPRSFRNFVSLRNPSKLLLSCVSMILKSFHNVDPFECSSTLNCKIQGSTWWIDCWFVALLASWLLR